METVLLPLFIGIVAITIFGVYLVIRGIVKKELLSAILGGLCVLVFFIFILIGILAEKR